MRVPVYEIEFGDHRAEVVARGAGLRSLTKAGRALIEPWSEESGSEHAPPSAVPTDPPPSAVPTDPPLSAGLVMAPWPNRIRNGRFRFDGVDHQLAITEPERDNAIHGLVRRDDWQLVDHRDHRVEQTIRVGLHKGWPYPLQLTVVHELGPDGLTVTHTAVNIGATPAPFGLGVHAFLRVGDVPLDDCTLRLTAGTWLPLDPVLMLPRGPSQAVTGTDLDFTAPRGLAGVQLDTPFSSIVPDHDGRARHELSAPDGTGTVLWTDRSFGWLQVFTADPALGQGFPGRGRALAVEPMTCPPDAFNSGIDQIVLAPGQGWTGHWGITAV